MSVETALRFRTCGKVNLFLRVLAQRPDGFHEVETILHSVDVCDEIEVVPTGGVITVEMRLAPGLDGVLPSDDENLVLRAADALRGGRTESGARIAVEKGIPIAAGLGGGSADAAATLVALCDLWELELSRAELMDLAESLGSDVPYCLDGGTVLATSRGEELTRLAQLTPMWFVLAGTTAPLYTRDVYAAWDHLPPAEESTSAAIVMALGAGDIADVASSLHNELEPAAFSLMPELERKKQVLLQAGALGAGMTGSGPTMYGLAMTEGEARSIAAEVEGRFDWVRVVRSKDRSIYRLDGS